MLRLLLPVVVLCATTLPALADIPVEIVSATNTSGRTVVFVVKTSPQAACYASETVTVGRSTENVGLGKATAGDDGTANFHVTFLYGGTRHVTVLCQLGNDKGSASTAVSIQ
jgi:hypothetical protein